MPGAARFPLVTPSPCHLVILSFRPMLAPSAVASRFRVLISRGLGFMGFRDDAFLLILAVLIGVITAAAAVGFHELIRWIGDLLYRRIDPEFLYRAGIPLIII